MLGENAVPDFVGVLDVDSPLRLKPIPNHLRKTTHEYIVCLVGYAKPGVCVQPVAQVDHPLQWHTPGRERGVGDSRAFIPTAQLGAVRLHPVHEPDAGYATPAGQEERVEGVFLPGVFKTGHDHVDVAYVVCRVGFHDAEEDGAFASIDLDNDAARAS